MLVLGGNFGGLTAALAVSHELRGDVDIRVISASDRFLFNPSLIWLPFGKRRPADITFPLAPTFGNHGIEFVPAEATGIDLASQKVTASTGVYDYDYLVIATGYRDNFAVATAVGVPKTGFPTERMAHVAARNIAAQIRGEPPRSHEAFGDMPAVRDGRGQQRRDHPGRQDAPARKHGLLIPGPQAHAMKLGFEKYFLWKARHGYVQLP